MQPRRVVVVVATVIIVEFLGQTRAQLARRRGFQSMVGGSEMRCGPGVPAPRAQYPGPAQSPAPSGPPQWNQGGVPKPPPSQWNQGGLPGFPSGFSPYHAAMLDMDFPFFFPGAASMFPGLFGPQRQQQFHRIVKRQIMSPHMNCQCDNFADCNVQATAIGRAFNSQCERRMQLVCCCRVS